MPKIFHIPNKEDTLTIECNGCGSKRIEAFQCECGKAFCRTCYPNAFEKDEFGESVEVTCPDCGAKTLFI